MVKLVTMEATTKTMNTLNSFFQKINSMLTSSSFEIFNPTTIQCDEHASAKIGLKNVYGDEFVENRTSGCEFHLQKSIDRHKKYFNTNDGTAFNMLVLAMKNSPQKATVAKKPKSKT